MDIAKVLYHLGCSENEIKTFSVLFEAGKGVSALYVSRKLNAPRATVYGHINSLIEKGLAKKSLDGEGGVFHAEDLTTILSLYDEKIEQIQSAKKTLQKIVAEHKPIVAHSPKFTVFESPNAADQILRDILRARASATYWFWPMKEMVKVIKPETFVSFHKERIKRGIWLHILWPEKQTVKLSQYPQLGPNDEKGFLRKIRVLSGSFDQLTGYGIYGTKVAFISSERENYGFIIDSEELSKTLKSQFEFLWEMGKVYKE